MKEKTFTRQEVLDIIQAERKQAMDIFGSDYWKSQGKSPWSLFGVDSKSNLQTNFEEGVINTIDRLEEAITQMK